MSDNEYALAIYDGNEVFIDPVTFEPWMTQKDMTSLFGVSVQNVGQILNRAEKKNLLPKTSVLKTTFTASDGKRYQAKHYNLNAILLVGYRTESPKTVIFREWIADITREHLQKVQRENADLRHELHAIKADLNDALLQPYMDDYPDEF